MSDFTTAYNQFLSLSNLSLKQYSDSMAELKRSRRRARAFLKLLGDPHTKFHAVHVTGTSGKGSVVNMMHAVLRSQGHNVASYLSPHPTSFSERFAWNDGLLPEKDLVAAMQDVLAAYETYLEKGEPLSFFELCTCLAFYTFHKAGAQWAVIEVGCGGRWDTTNLLPTPKVAIITNIDRDHIEILGHSLKSIAYEKAGIIKKDGVAIVGESRPSLKSVFTKEAIEQNAALFFVPPAGGDHRDHNAALVKRAAQEIGIAPETADEAIKNTRPLPCRFETVQTRPLIILDGAHSEAKIKTTTRAITALKKPVHVIFGCAENKDARTMIELLAGVCDRITTTRFTGTHRKAANPSALLKMVPKEKRDRFFLNPHDALDYVKKSAKNRAIIITGSFFLSGELREIWYSEERIRKEATSFPQS